MYDITFDSIKDSIKYIVSKNDKKKKIEELDLIDQKLKNKLSKTIF